MSKVEIRIKEQKAKAIEYYKAMPVLVHAAAFAGVTDETLQRWRKEDPKFSLDLQVAKAEFIRTHGKKAKSEFLLERLDKENFKESKELEVKLPTPIMSLTEDKQDEPQD